MKEKQRDVDSMQFRKATHVAGVDVEIIIDDLGKCELTIKDAYYQTGVNVSGNKTDGYFIEFEENVKDMVVNSVNRKTIGDIVKVNKGLTSIESRNLKNWVGVRIELTFDPNVSFGGEVTGGIVVAKKSPIPDISDENALKVIGSSKTIEELQANWGKISKSEQKLPTVNALKDKLKEELK